VLGLPGIHPRHSTNDSAEEKEEEEEDDDVALSSKGERMQAVTVCRSMQEKPRTQLVGGESM
jgi:hypothetical protein